MFHYPQMLHPLIAEKVGRISKITIPSQAHPLVRLLYMLMKKYGTTHDLLADASGVLRQTTKSWRREKFPGIRAIEANLGAFGYRLLPCPSIDDLPPHLRDQLQEIGMHFFSDDEALAAAVFLATSKPRKATAGPAPRLDLKPQPYREMAA